MVENILVNSGLGGHILADPLGIQSGLVHADQTDGGEVIGKGAQIPLGIRV